MAFSRLSVSEMRGMGIGLREARAAQAETVSEPFVMPNAPTITFSADMPGSAQADPNAVFTMELEYSTDAGQTWRRWAHMTTIGYPEVTAQPGYPEATMPWWSCGGPPPGTLVRTRARIGDAPMTTGWQFRTR